MLGAVSDRECGREVVAHSGVFEEVRVCESTDDSPFVVELVRDSSAVGQESLCETRVPFVVVVFECDGVVGVELEDVGECPVAIGIADDVCDPEPPDEPARDEVDPRMRVIRLWTAVGAGMTEAAGVVGVAD